MSSLFPKMRIFMKTIGIAGWNLEAKQPGKIDTIKKLNRKPLQAREPLSSRIHRQVEAMHRAE